MKREIQKLASLANLTSLSNSQTEEFSKVIANRCIEIVEKFDSNYAIKMIKKEFEIDQNEK